MSERYTGPVCYIDRDWHGVKRSLIPWGKPRVVVTHHAGWHYGTTLNKQGHEEPNPKLRLHLNDSNPDDLFYEIARDEHKSWLEKHGEGNVVALQPLIEEGADG